MAKRGLTPIGIANLQPRAERFEVPDRRCAGLYVVVQPSGKKVFAFRYRRPNKTTAKLTLGRWCEVAKGTKEEPVLGGPLSLAAARKLASDALHRLRQGVDPGAAALEAKGERKAAAANTLRVVAEQFLALEAVKLRTGGERRNIFQRAIYPVLGDRPIAEIRRGDVVKLLDVVETERGPRSADETLATLSRLFNWWAVRDETFRTPLVRGMGRAAPAHERARTRVLSDDEIRAVWAAAGAMGVDGAFMKFLLLTTARRNEVAAMRWSEVSALDWTLPAVRNKTKQDLVRPLSGAALSVLASVPRVDGCDFVFTHDGRRPIANFSRMKRELDERSGVSNNWRFHDLRRTARSLLSRAGVPSEIGERCLGHAIGNLVQRTYDRHKYSDEMRHALEALAAQIERIVTPPPKVVVPLRGR